MKRILLAASLGIAALVLAPIASANAATALKGTCTFQGKATFPGGNLSTTTPKHTSFLFVNTTGECVTEAGTKGTVIKAEVEGEGPLSCGVAENMLELPEVVASGKVAGEVKALEVEFPGKLEKLKLKAFFRFVAGAGALAFRVEGEAGSATNSVGPATFLTNTNNLKECTNPTGAKELEFRAAAGGTLEVEP
jgi:hypothetical protein